MKKPTVKKQLDDPATVRELLDLAREFSVYWTKMPNDPFARRWRLVSLALISQANSMQSS